MRRNLKEGQDEGLWVPERGPGTVMHAMGAISDGQATEQHDQICFSAAPCLW